MWPSHRALYSVSQCLASVPDTSISGVRVVRELTALVARCGKPEMIVSDNGTELTSNAVLKWAQDHCMQWHYRFSTSQGRSRFSSLNLTLKGCQIAAQVIQATGSLFESFVG